MKYTAVFEFEEAPHIKKGDTWLGGELCALSFSDALEELALLQEKMAVIEAFMAERDPPTESRMLFLA